MAAPDEFTEDPVRSVKEQQKQQQQVGEGAPC